MPIGTLGWICLLVVVEPVADLEELEPVALDEPVLVMVETVVAVVVMVVDVTTAVELVVEVAAGPVRVN